MRTSYNVLVLGASYGSLLGVKLLLAGHSIRLVCLAAEAEAINEDGIRVLLPVRASGRMVEVHSPALPGTLSAGGAETADPSEFDLVVLAMQEPQYGAPGVRQLLEAVARTGVPCMSIMNMPPLPYLSRIPGLSLDAITHCYTDPSVWDGFDPDLLTLASPDPQAFRPPDRAVNVLQVSLPTNFKVARFESDQHTDMLRRMQSDIESIRFDDSGAPIELPVKLKVHDSVFVPLAKWSMLLTGNYRCIRRGFMISIKEAVHGDVDLSRSVYEWVSELCRTLGAATEDQVPFEKYANAAVGLEKPSSAARALSAGAVNIERVDCLVKTIASHYGMHSAVIDEIVALVDERLEANRSQG